jgi:hypothetical protein
MQKILFTVNYPGCNVNNYEINSCQINIIAVKILETQKMIAALYSSNDIYFWKYNFD